MEELMYPFKDFQEVPSANWVLEHPPAQVLMWINEVVKYPKN
jgi:hypothetical protein